MSKYQREVLRQGQTSPLSLGDYAIAEIRDLYHSLGRPLRILDIGSGSGAQMDRIVRHCGEHAFSQRVGLDWSVEAVNRLKTSTIYNQVKLCQSSELPFDNGEFDIAISIENLEHLYASDVLPAIREMMRVADKIVIITPHPRDVVNLGWLRNEISATIRDREVLNAEDYQMLEGAVHKSVVVPSTMATAGFKLGAGDHGRYSASSAAVDLDQIEVIGINASDAEPLERKYLNLLKASLALDSRLNHVRNL